MATISAASASDKALFDWLEGRDPECRRSLGKCLESWAYYSSWGMGDRLATGTAVARSEALDLLRWYGTHAVTYFLPGSTVSSYVDVVRGTAEVLRTMAQEQLDAEARDRQSFIQRYSPFRSSANSSVRVPDVPMSDVSELEDYLCDRLLQVAFSGKDEASIREVLEHSGMDQKAAGHAAKEIVGRGATGLTLAFLVELLGKRVLYNVLMWALYNFVRLLLGEEAAAWLVGELAKRVPQYAVQFAMRAVVWVINIYVVHQLLGPSTRCTAPFVMQVAVLRRLERTGEA